MEETGTVRSPCVVIESGRSTYSRAASLEGRAAIESGVDTSLVEVGGESIQLAMQVETVPEEGLIEILAPQGSDKALYKRVRGGHEGDGLELLDVENSQIRTPAVKSEQRVMIGTEALGKWLTAPGLLEHASDADAVDMRGFGCEPIRLAITDDGPGPKPDRLRYQLLTGFEPAATEKALHGRGLGTTTRSRCGFAFDCARMASESNSCSK